MGFHSIVKILVGFPHTSLCAQIWVSLLIVVHWPASNPNASGSIHLCHQILRSLPKKLSLYLYASSAEPLLVWTLRNDMGDNSSRHIKEVLEFQASDEADDVPGRKSAP